LQSTPVGSTIYRNIQALDKDAGVNGLVEYFIVEGSKNISDISPDTLTAADGFGVFAISYPHQGQVRKIKKNYPNHFHLYFCLIWVLK
jgi:protocadherin-15